MKLDPDLIQYLTKDHFRVLTAVEMGMKNHEFVPNQLVESLSGLKRATAYKILQFLLKHKMVFHTGKNYDGYALTNMGYDYLVIKVFMKRGIIKKVGLKIGMGKESDIYICSTDNEDRPNVIVKFARLGRTSFRSVKTNRDYIKQGHGVSSWLYLSRLASLKEYAFMKALYDRGFPTPVPIDANRHGICMSLVNAYPMT
jgi:RIO kinase 2